MKDEIRQKKKRKPKKAERVTDEEKPAGEKTARKHRKSVTFAS